MKKIIIFLLTSIIAVNIYANEPEYCSPDVFSKETSNYYPEALKSAKSALKTLCVALLKDNPVVREELHNKFSHFHNVLHNEASSKLPSKIVKVLEFRFGKPLFEYSSLSVRWNIPDINFPRDHLDRTISIQLTGEGSNTFEENLPMEEAKNCFENEPCRKSLILYGDLLFKLYNPVRAKPVESSLKYISAKNKKWDRFIEEGRSQTFLDIGLTSSLYERFYGKSEHDFLSPPEVQWFFLHPSVLIENVSDAVDGQQVQESLALEIIGFNYWDKKCFGMACGASLIVNYADRSGVSDTRWGVMIHTDNSYSFGITAEGKDADNTGFFVTVDLLKLFQDKKDSLKNYKEKYKSLIDR